MFDVKILSGPMYGVDITLPSEDIFFLAGGAGDTAGGNAEHVAERAPNILFIPAGEDEPNFALCLSNAEKPIAQVFHEEGIERIVLPLNRPRQLGKVWLAVKPQAEPWSDAVLGFVAGQGRRNESRGKALSARLLLSFALLVSLLLAVAAWGAGFKSPLQHSLTKVLAPLDAAIQEGRDGQSYVVVGSSRDVGVARRAIARSGLPSDAVRVVSRAGEQRRLSQLLDQAAIAFIVLRLDDPCEPVLLLSDSHTAFVDQSLRDNIREQLLEWAPYAEEVEMQFIAEAQLLQRGRELLARAAVPYEECREGAAHVFVIRRALDDQQIADMNDALGTFQRLWGDRQVRFQLSTGEDPLRGKTFRSGTAGYLLEQGKHWIYARTESGRTSTGP